MVEGKGSIEPFGSLVLWFWGLLWTVLWGESSWCVKNLC